METTLLISEHHDAVCDLIGDAYSCITAADFEQAHAVLDERHDEIVAVLVDSKLCVEDDFAFLDSVEGNAKLVFVAVMVLHEGVATAEDVLALQHGAIDSIRLDELPEIVLNRITNGIRVQKIKTCYELDDVLRALPALIFFKDCEGKYLFSTHPTKNFKNADDYNSIIRGKTDLELRTDTENVTAAMSSDERILATGEGERYTVRVERKGKPEYYDVTKEPVFDERGNIIGIIGLVNDVTEQELLRLKYQRASTIDGLTGLYNRIETQRRIDEHLGSIRNQDFSLIMLDIDNFKYINDTHGHQTGDLVLQVLSDLLLRECSDCPEGTAVGRWGGEEFMVLLADTGAREATGVAMRIRECFEQAPLENISVHTVSLGVTQAQENDSIDSLYSRVDHALYAAKASGKNRICTL